MELDDHGSHSDGLIETSSVVGASPGKALTKIANTVNKLRARQATEKAQATGNRFAAVVRAKQSANGAEVAGGGGKDASVRTLPSEGDDEGAAWELGSDREHHADHHAPESDTARLDSPDSLPPPNSTDLSTDVAQWERDPFVLAGRELLRHGAFKAQLYELLERTSERSAVLADELHLKHSLQEEIMKTSATKRKVILSLTDQVRQQCARRDRLLVQRKSQSHAIIDSLQRTLDKLATERVELEARVSAAVMAFKSAQEQVLKLRGIVADAAARADLTERLSSRVARREKLSCETAHRNDVERWLSMLRGETESARQKRIKEKRMVEAQQLDPAISAAVRHRQNLAPYLRPDLDKHVSALGDGEALEEMLSTRDVRGIADKAEGAYKLRFQRSMVRLAVSAPAIAREQRAYALQRREEVQERKAAAAAAHAEKARSPKKFEYGAKDEAPPRPAECQNADPESPDPQLNARESMPRSHSNSTETLSEYDVDLGPMPRIEGDPSPEATESDDDAEPWGEQIPHQGSSPAQQSQLRTPFAYDSAPSTEGLAAAELLPESIANLSTTEGSLSLHLPVIHHGVTSAKALSSAAGKSPVIPSVTTLPPLDIRR
jgi:hypothetical protein